MARYTGPVCRLCRREGKKLFLKGDKCYTGKCAIETRQNSLAPGQHGARRKKLSEYGMQHRAKQSCKNFYGVSERQMTIYFAMADRKGGVTGENLLVILESRLDNVVYRMGFAASRAEARQLVTHAHLTVNGKKCNIPSYRVKEGDVIAFSRGSMQSEKIKGILEAAASHPVPGWLDVNVEKAEGKVVKMPARDEIDIDVEEHLIVELYSK